MANRLDIFAQTRWEGVPQALWRSAQVRKRKLPIEHKCAPCCSPCTRARQSSRLPAWHSFRPSQAVEQEWSKILRARRQEDASIANHKSGDSARLACIVILPKEGRCSRGARGSKRLQEGAALARSTPMMSHLKTSTASEHKRILRPVCVVSPTGQVGRAGGGRQ